MKSHCFILILVIGLCFSFCSGACEGDDEDSCVVLSSTSPVTLDTILFFSVDVRNYNMDEDEELYFEFDDGLFHQEETFLGHTLHHGWNISYDKSKYHTYTGWWRAHITVKQKTIAFFWTVLDTAHVDFRITDGITGFIRIQQPNITLNKDGDNYDDFYGLAPYNIATGNNTNLTAVVHDPYLYIRDHSLTVEFYWMINGRDVGSCMTPSIVTNITKPGQYLIIVNVVVTLGNLTVTTTTPATTSTTKAPKLSINHHTNSSTATKSEVGPIKKLPARNNATAGAKNAKAKVIVANDSKNNTQQNNVVSDVMKNGKINNLKTDIAKSKVVEYSSNDRTLSKNSTRNRTAKHVPPTPPPPPPTPPPTPTPGGYKCGGIWPGWYNLGVDNIVGSRGLAQDSIFNHNIHDNFINYALTTHDGINHSNNNPARDNSGGGFNQSVQHNQDVSVINLHQSSISLDPPKLIIGTFSKAVTAKDPIRHVHVNGSTWLKRGQLINLSVTCDGTGDWSFCWQIKHGLYNITGKEECDSVTWMTQKCQFDIMYLLLGTAYTFIIIINNGVSHSITPIGINIFRKQAATELYLVLVPVACACVVFSFLVYSVAFFIRRRRRHIVEVADFDFVGSSCGGGGAVIGDGGSDGLGGMGVWSHVVAAFRQWREQGVEDDDRWRSPRHVEHQPSILDDEED